MRGRFLLAAVLLVGVGVFLVVGSSPGSSRGGGRTGGSGDHYLGPIAPGTEVHFGFSLRMRSAALQRYAAAVGAGSEPALSAAQIGERFGVGGALLAFVRSRLMRAGVRVDEAFKQRTELLVSGSAARVERLLGVGLGEYSERDGVRYHRPVGIPVIPADLRSAISGATQLNSKPMLVADDVPAGGMTASSVESLYDLGPLEARGLNGSGQTIAVFSEDTFKDSDIDQFDQEHGIVGAPSVQRVEVNGPVRYQGGDPATEVDLDIEVIRELAPKAQIVNYEACCGVNAFSPGIDKIVSDGRARLVNFSYGFCELDLTPRSALISANNSFAAAEAHGITVFASSGDQGSYECQRENPSDHRLSVSWPGSSPNVVSVGGTFVELRPNGTRLDELGWEGILSHAGGGGGVSAVFPRPSWQTGDAGIDNGYTTNPPRRESPDVSADASPASGYSIVTGGSNQEDGGTSAAAPFWTGSFALIDQLAERETGHALPFIAPLLYEAAARDRRAFYDVTLGGNRFYRAGPGWDYSTGLGTPDMARLAGDVIGLARQR